MAGMATECVTCPSPGVSIRMPATLPLSQHMPMMMMMMWPCCDAMGVWAFIYIFTDMYLFIHMYLLFIIYMRMQVTKSRHSRACTGLGAGLGAGWTV